MEVNASPHKGRVCAHVGGCLGRDNVFIGQFRNSLRISMIMEITGFCSVPLNFSYAAPSSAGHYFPTSWENDKQTPTL